MRRCALTTALLALATVAERGTARATRDWQPASYLLTFTTTSRSSHGSQGARDSVLTMRVRDGRARIDFPPNQPVEWLPGAYYLYDARRAESIVVLPSQRAFVVFDSVGMVDSIAQVATGDQVRLKSVTAFRDSLGAGETVEGFTSLRFRMGIGSSLTVDSEGKSVDGRFETEEETHLSGEIDALDPAFAALVRSDDPGPERRGRAAPFAGDTAMQRAIRETRPAAGFPILTHRTLRVIVRGDTSTTTFTTRLTSFTRVPVDPDDLLVPKGFVATDRAGLSRMQRAMVGPARGIAVPPR